MKGVLCLKKKKKLSRKKFLFIFHKGPGISLRERRLSLGLWSPLNPAELHMNTNAFWVKLPSNGTHYTALGNQLLVTDFKTDFPFPTFESVVNSKSSDPRNIYQTPDMHKAVACMVSPLHLREVL